MGAANSSEVPVVQRETEKEKVKSDDDVPSSEFDVSTKDKAQLEAYEKGKGDASKLFQSQLEQIAAQVYDDLHSQLKNLQKDSIEKSKSKVEDIKSKLTVAHTRSNPCEKEQTILIQCLKPKKDSDSLNDRDKLLGVDCIEAVNAYVSCATASAIQ